MDGANLPKLALFTVLMALAPGMSIQAPPRSHFTPHPLCLSQFSLANSACMYLPYSPGPPPSPPSPPSPTPSPPLPENGHEHGHRHRHRGRHHGHNESPVEQQCCRWVKEVDSQCVCEMLLHLPLFLAKPFHQYTIVVDNTCNVTYHCEGRMRL